MQGAGAVVCNKGDDGRRNSVGALGDAEEKVFRKNLSNRKILCPPGGYVHPEDPMNLNGNVVRSEPLTQRRRCLKVSPREHVGESNPPVAGPDHLGSNFVPVDIPVKQGLRQRSEIAEADFTEYTKRFRQRQVDLIRYEPDGGHFRTMKARASSCPPAAIREADDGGSGVEQRQDAVEQAAGISQGQTRERRATQKKLLPPGRSTMASYIQYDPKEILISTHDRRVEKEVDFAQRCRDIVHVSTFAGRVAEAVKRTNHNSYSGGVGGCLHWGA